MLYMAKKPLPLRIDEDLLRRVDEARGDVPRTRFVERALEATLGGQGPGSTLGGPTPTRSGSVKEAAPAESSTPSRASKPPPVPGVQRARSLVRDDAAMERQRAMNKAKGL